MSDESNREMLIFTEALRLPPEGRSDYVTRACAGDDNLLRKVQALLGANDRAGRFLDELPSAFTEERIRQAGAIEKPGDWIGRYHLLQQIGEGGWGIVFLAEQKEPVRRRVALKIIKPGMDTKNVIARFEAERQALALMDHPNIAKVFDADATDSGRPYFVMELVRGIKITDYCDQHSLSTEERLALFVQVCEAVQHAHQKGIIHRDIKPSNILVTQSLEGAALPIVIDFGVAKAMTNQQLTDKTLFTAFEMLIGTPAYMSPEQAALTTIGVDTRTDIYSLGVLLYELLTGSTPFNTTELLKGGIDEIRRVIRDLEPERPSTRLSRMAEPNLTTVAQNRQSEPPRLIRTVRGDLDWIVIKCLEKDRTRRYETANELALDVKRFLQNETISARPPSRLYQFRKMVQRNMLVFVAASVVAILTLASLIVVSVALAKERQTRRQLTAALLESKTEAAKGRETKVFLEYMLDGVGLSVRDGGDPTVVQNVLGRAAKHIGVGMTNQPVVEAELRDQIGRLYSDVGNYNQAEPILRDAVASTRAELGPNSAETAIALNDLAWALFRKNNLDEAEHLNVEALDIRQKLFGHESAQVAESMDHLASVYRHQRNLAEADKLIRESLGIRERKFGTNSPEAADSLHNLAVVLDDEGKPAQSEVVADRLLSIRERFDKDDPTLAAALGDSAWAASQNGKLEKSESLYEQTLTARRKYLGDDHPEVAKTIAALGEVMRKRGNLTDADAVMSAAVAIEIKLLGDDNRDTLYSLENLASIFEREGKWPEAETVYGEMLAGWRKRAGDEFPDTIQALVHYTKILIAEKKFDEAKRELDKTLTPDFARKPGGADLLPARLQLLACQGKWAEAASDQALLLEYHPEEHYHYHRMAAFLIMTRNHPAYTMQLCARILATFTNTTNVYVTERMAEDCLEWTNSGVDLAVADKLADKGMALAKDTTELTHSEACKALSAYRLGRYGEAIDWANKSLMPPSIFVQVKACAILAMAHWRLGHKDEAKAMLAKADTLMPTTEPDDPEGTWVPWLFARILLDEATHSLQSNQ